ncbi:MAG TPA: nuclear transport factor 2 family protein [Longimicrobium sp.]
MIFTAPHRIVHRCPGALIMRRFSKLSSALVGALLALTACAGNQSPASEPAVVDHPMHTPILVTMMRLEEEAHALQDSAIIRMVRERVDEWNQGNLDAFLAMYVPEAEYVVGSRYLNARDAVRRIHTARWFGDGGTGRPRLSVRLLRSETAGDAARRLETSWTVTDHTGSQETWTSSLAFRLLPEAGWHVIQERSSLGETAGQVSGRNP